MTATRDQLLATFEANQAMLVNAEVLIDYLQPFGRPFGPNIMDLNHEMQVHEQFHAVFWRVLFAMDASFQFINGANPGLVQIERMRRPASDTHEQWSVYKTGIYGSDFQRGPVQLRNTEPLPGWIVDGLPTSTEMWDLRAVTGWLMGLIGDGRPAAVMARFWAEIAEEPSKPLCTGFDAAWCPNCGSCICNRPVPEFYAGQHGEHYETDFDQMNTPGCPVHDQTVSLHRARKLPRTVPAKEK